jgi:hypothetical protein
VSGYPKGLEEPAPRNKASRLMNRSVTDLRLQCKLPAAKGGAGGQYLAIVRTDSVGLLTLEAQVFVGAALAHICPAGHKLYCSGKNMLFNGYRVASFKAPKTACRGCHLRERCLGHPDRTPHRQLTFIKHPEGPPPKRCSKCNGAVQRMRQKFDTPLGRELYSRRMGTVEPVFANIQNKGMRRFILRGQSKVSAQVPHGQRSVSQPESTNRRRPTHFHWKVRQWRKAKLALVARLGFSTASLGSQDFRVFQVQDQLQCFASAWWNRQDAYAA